MYYGIIACNVFFREICLCAARSPHVLDLHFTEKGDHEDPNRLRSIIGDRIAEAEESGKAYDALLLGYGLCGNSLAGVGSGIFPLVIPRAHDCCTVFLGSTARFREHFGDNPSRPFTSSGYRERGASRLNTSETRRFLGLDKSYEEYVALYGEENARYIMETLAPAREEGDGEELVFIDVPETSFTGHAELCRKAAEEAGKDFVRLEGDIRILRSLVDCVWDPAACLVLSPGETISPVYDWNEIVRAVRRAD